MQSGWSGGPWLQLSFRPAPLFFIYFLASHPQACTLPGGCCRLHIRGTAERAGLGGAGGRRYNRLARVPSFPTLGFGGGGTERDRTHGWGLSLVTGRIIETLIRRDGKRRVRDGGGAGDGGENTRGHPWVASRARSGVPMQSGVCAGFPGPTFLRGAQPGAERAVPIRRKDFMAPWVRKAEGGAQKLSLGALHRGPAGILA